MWVKLWKSGSLMMVESEWTLFITHYHNPHFDNLWFFYHTTKEHEVYVPDGRICPHCKTEIPTKVLNKFRLVVKLSGRCE